MSHYPTDALDLLDLPSVLALTLIGAVFGAFVVWQSFVLRAGIVSAVFTTFLMVSIGLVFFVFLISFRAYSETPHWGRTISTAIEWVFFALGAGAGLAVRRRTSWA